MMDDEPTSNSESPAQRLLRLYVEGKRRLKAKAGKRDDYLEKAERAKADRKAYQEEYREKKKRRLREQRHESKCLACKEELRSTLLWGGYCLVCYQELKHGVIPFPAFSLRQLNSMACRNIRKGSSMS